jgi:rhodanese-related sulfurtransferase
LFRRAAFTALALCLPLHGSLSVGFAESRFPDTAGHWAEVYIEALAGKGVIKGMDDGLFHPGLPVTTGQFVSMAIRAGLGAETPALPGGTWDSGYLGEALGRGVIDSAQAAERNVPLARRNAAKICHNALSALFAEPDVSDASAVAVAESLGDLYSCKTCVAHVAQMYVKGVMLGRPDGMFHGDDTLTRAEAATIITKMMTPSLREPRTLVPEPSPAGTITPEEAHAMLETDKGALLVDVRSPEEHESGHIIGSLCVPLPDISEDISRTPLPKDKSAAIIVYCQSGIRSQKAYELLKKAGYQAVYDVGGIKDWPYGDITSASAP